jgi:hypothetical protein
MEALTGRLERRHEAALEKVDQLVAAAGLERVLAQLDDGARGGRGGRIVGQGVVGHGGLRKMKLGPGPSALLRRPG